MNKIDLNALKEYENIFGKEKMKNLWLEFSQDAKIKLKNPENKNLDEIRLIFHSLRSSSLVFGMSDFAKFCSEIEENIVEKKSRDVILKMLPDTLKSFTQSQKNVEEYFFGKD